MACAPKQAFRGVFALDATFLLAVFMSLYPSIVVVLPIASCIPKVTESGWIRKGLFDPSFWNVSRIKKKTRSADGSRYGQFFGDLTEYLGKNAAHPSKPHIWILHRRTLMYCCICCHCDSIGNIYSALGDMVEEPFLAEGRLQGSVAIPKPVPNKVVEACQRYVKAFEKRNREIDFQRSTDQNEKSPKT